MNRKNLFEIENHLHTNVKVFNVTFDQLIKVAD